jgi:hypothetical protein
MILDLEIDKLAKELHKFYRAASQVLEPRKCNMVVCDHGPRCKKIKGQRHDHGWKACHEKAYFVRRAKALAQKMNDRDYSRFPKHMQSLDTK